MVIKNIQVYNAEIERLKVRIRRIRAEKRVAILMQQEQETADNSSGELLDFTEGIQAQKGAG